MMNEARTLIVVDHKIRKWLKKLCLSRGNCRTQCLCQRRQRMLNR